MTPLMWLSALVALEVFRALVIGFAVWAMMESTTAAGGWRHVA